MRWMRGKGKRSVWKNKGVFEKIDYEWRKTKKDLTYYIIQKTIYASKPL